MDDEIVMNDEVVTPITESDIEQTETKLLLSINTNADGFINQFCVGGIVENETHRFELTELPTDFFELYQAYKVVDDSLILDEQQSDIIKHNSELETLRVLREQECFSVINRGKMWYNHLTDEQLEELDDWYNAWLEVTETKVIPIKPEWLN